MVDYRVLLLVAGDLEVEDVDWEEEERRMMEESMEQGGEVGVCCALQL